VIVFAQDKAPPQQSAPGIMSMLPMLLAMFLVVYFLMIRPQQKKQKDTKKMLDEIKKGDKIVTIGGMLGTVGNVKDTTVMVKVAENTVIEFKKSAVHQVVAKDGTEKKEIEEKK
jgi:preprotein translocase subunit YajC